MNYLLKFVSCSKKVVSDTCLNIVIMHRDNNCKCSNVYLRISLIRIHYMKLWLMVYLPGMIRDGFIYWRSHCPWVILQVPLQSRQSVSNSVFP